MSDLENEGESIINSLSILEGSKDESNALPLQEQVNVPSRLKDKVSNEVFGMLNELLSEYGFSVINGSLQITNKEFQKLDNEILDLSRVAYNQFPAVDSTSRVIDTTLEEVSSYSGDLVTALSPFQSSVNDWQRQYQEPSNISTELFVATYKESFALIRKWYQHQSNSFITARTGSSPVSSYRAVGPTQSVIDNISPNVIKTTNQLFGRGPILFIHNEGALYQEWKRLVEQQVSTYLPTATADILIDTMKSFRYLSWQDLPVYPAVKDYRYLLENVSSIIFLLQDLPSYQYQTQSSSSLFSIAENSVVSLIGTEKELIRPSSAGLQRLLLAINEEQKARNLIFQNKGNDRKKVGTEAVDRIPITLVGLSPFLSREGGTGFSRQKITEDLFGWFNPSFEKKLQKEVEELQNQIILFCKEYQYPYTVLHTGYLLARNQSSVDNETASPATMSINRPMSFHYYDDTKALRSYSTLPSEEFFTKIHHVTEAISRNINFPHTNNTIIQLVSDLTIAPGQNMTQVEWDDEFLKFVGPELLRIPLQYCQNIPELFFFLFYQVQQALEAAQASYVTPIEIERTYFGLRIRFKPYQSKYDEQANFKQLKQQEKEVLDNNRGNRKKSRYVSPEIEKQQELVLQTGNQTATASKTKEKVIYEGGLEVILEEKPYHRIRIRRVPLPKNSIVKEETEKRIIDIIQKNIARLEKDYRLLQTRKIQKRG